MKKFFMILGIISATSILVACGNEGEIAKTNNEGSVVQNDEQKQNTEPSNEVMNSKTVKLFSSENYYMKYETEDAEQPIAAELSKKGEEFAERSISEEGIIRLVQKDSKEYTIMDDAKMIMESPLAEGEGAKGRDFLPAEDAVFTTGKETIDGVEYDYEDFDGTRAYFLGNDLKIIKNGADNSTLKIITFEQKANEEMFEIPTDYSDFSNYMGGTEN